MSNGKKETWVNRELKKKTRVREKIRKKDKKKDKYHFPSVFLVWGQTDRQTDRQG